MDVGAKMCVVLCEEPGTRDHLVGRVYHAKNGHFYIHDIGHVKTAFIVFHEIRE